MMIVTVFMQNTFQLALISGTLSDKRSLTFAMYLYGDIGWSVSQPVMMGHYLQTPHSTQTDNHTSSWSNLHSPFNKPSTYDIDTVVNGRTGM